MKAESHIKITTRPDDPHRAGSRPVNLDVTGLGKSPSVSLDTAPAAEDNVVEEFVVLNVDRTVFQEESNLTGQIKSVFH